MTQLPLEIGDIVELYAVDWGIHEQQLDESYDFDIVRGRIYGCVVRITDDAITVAPQVFDGGGVRYALAVPIATILRYSTLVSAFGTGERPTTHEPTIGT